jgi:RecB family endonuclease NucS
MATKYGYVKRDPQDTQLNWSQIATDVTDMLQNEVKVREDKKAAIDQATRDYQEILNNVPQGENTQLNEFSLNAAEKLQKQMLMQETLLKSGQLNPKQYTIMRQNLTDGTDQAFGLLQDYNDEYAEKMAMMDSNLPISERASEMQTWMMSQVEGFANFTETELVINPETGIMSMAKLIDDGSGNLIPDPNPNNLVTVQQLRNRIKTKYTQYDVFDGADKYIETLGKESKIIEDLGNKYKAGIFKTIKDIRDREGGFKDKTPAELATLAKEMGIQPNELKAYSLFEQSQLTYINGQLSNPNYAASVLVDFMGQTFDGKDYTLTFDPDEAKNDSSVVLLKSVNGRVEAQLTDEQKNAAVEAYKAQIDIGLDYEEEARVQQVYKEPRARTATETSIGKGETVQKNVMTNVAKIYYGDEQELLEAENFLKSNNPDIVAIDKDGTNVIIEYKDGKRETIPFESASGGTQSQEQWVKGATNYFLSEKNKMIDIDKVARQSEIDFSRGLSDAKGVVAQEDEQDMYLNAQGAQLTLDEAAYEVLKNESPNVLTKDDEDKSKSNVNSFLAGTGYIVDTRTDGDDKLFIFKQGKTSNTDMGIEIDLEQGDLAKEMDKLIKLKFDTLDATQKALKAKKLKKTVKRKKSLRGAAVGNNRTTATAKDRSGYNKPQ